MFDFFIVGGDKRLSYMANLLTYKGFKVLAYDLDGENLNEKVKQVSSIKFALKNSKNIIGPIPFSKDFAYLNSRTKKIYIEEILCNLKSHNKLFGGGFNGGFDCFCGYRFYCLLPQILFLSYILLIGFYAGIPGLKIF